MAEEVKRFKIYKYIKSGKITAITSHSGFEGRTLIDMSQDMRQLEKIRSVKYLKPDALALTDYILEAIENIEKVNGIEYSISYRLLRILTDKDIDETKWKNTESLSELPVGEHPHISKEERLWAGEREGNIGSGVTLVIWVCFTWWLVWWLDSVNKPDVFMVSFALIAAVSSYFLVVFKWRAPKKPQAEKLKELNDYKKRLRQDARTKQEQTRTDIEKLLEKFSNWERLSPKEFEHALTYTLEKEGYNLRVTKYVGDGGVDLKGTNVEGKPIIVQAKKYSSNVGVAVVREMIGVRESSPDKPKTMIVALIGFTRGAIQLAEQEGVILKSIKKDILKV